MLSARRLRQHIPKALLQALSIHTRREPPLLSRLYNQARKTADKLEARRKKVPVDAKTGAPLFRPSTGRAPLSDRNATVMPVGERLFNKRCTMAPVTSLSVFACTCMFLCCKRKTPDHLIHREVHNGASGFRFNVCVHLHASMLQAVGHDSFTASSHLFRVSGSALPIASTHRGSCCSAAASGRTRRWASKPRRNSRFGSP